MQLSMTISTISPCPSLSPPHRRRHHYHHPPSTIERPKPKPKQILRVSHHVWPPQALRGSGFLSAIDRVIEEEEYRQAMAEVSCKGFDSEGYSIEGVSIGGHETCVIVPELKTAFDIGRCPSRAVQQNFVFITHAHLDHIGGLPMYVATRALYNLKPPTIFVPPCIKVDVEKLFDIHRTMSQEKFMKCGITLLYDYSKLAMLPSQATFLDEGYSIKYAHEHGHTHLFELIDMPSGSEIKLFCLLISRPATILRTSVRLCQNCNQRYQPKWLP